MVELRANRVESGVFYMKSKIFGETLRTGNHAKTYGEINETASTVAEIDRRVSDLVREYERMLSGNLRRAEIANEISTLRLKLESLKRAVEPLEENDLR